MEHFSNIIFVLILWAFRIIYPITFASQSFPVLPPLIPDAHVSPHPQQNRKKKVQFVLSMYSLKHGQTLSSLPL